MPDRNPDKLVPEVIPAGQDGVAVRFSLTANVGAMAAAQRLIAELESDSPAGVVEIAPGLVSALLRFDPAQTSRASLAGDLLSRARNIASAPPALPDPVRRWTIPVAFGEEHGPQLDEVAQHIGCSASDAVGQICKADLRVLAIGFAPGQPYIGLLPDAWNLPRLSQITPNVPAGAIVVAVRQVVMFTAESATGWRQVGHSAFRNFLPDRETPTPLQAGDAICFAPVSASELDGVARDASQLGGARLEKLR